MEKGTVEPRAWVFSWERGVTDVLVFLKQCSGDLFFRGVEFILQVGGA